MLVALDLTARQTARILTQALRTRAKIEVEPRPEAAGSLLWCTLEEQANGLLRVTLVPPAQEVPVLSLIGAMCEVRIVLSGQLYLFSTVIVDAADNASPAQLMLATPTGMQVANRRRYVRKSPADPVPVRLTVPGAPEPFVGAMTNIGPTGVGCRLPKRGLDDVLFIGDQVEVEFVLPWLNQVYTLPASVCSKSAGGDSDHFIAGFEFSVGGSATARATLQLLRAAISAETKHLTELEGEI